MSEPNTRKLDERGRRPKKKTDRDLLSEINLLNLLLFHFFIFLKIHHIDLGRILDKYYDISVKHGSRFPMLFKSRNYIYLMIKDYNHKIFSLNVTLS